jgi:hypothetical protein
VLVLFLSSFVVVHGATYGHGKNIKVVFSSQNVVAGSCTGNNNGRTGWPGAKGASGEVKYPAYSDYLPIGGPYTFSFTCKSSVTGSNITATDYLTIIRDTETQVSFNTSNTVSPFKATITKFDSDDYYGSGPYTLFWSYSDQYGSCTLDGSAVSISGSKSFSAPSPRCEEEFVRNHTLSCNAPGITSSSASLTHTVPAKTGCKPV